MNLDRLTDAELADLGENVLSLLSGTELYSIDPVVRAVLLAAMGTLPAELAASTADAAIKNAEKIAAYSGKHLLEADVLEGLRRVRDTLRSVRAPKEHYDLCGFNYPQTRSNAYLARDPSNMAADGFSNGVNRMSFSGNNKPGLVVYEIWKRDAKDAEWRQHAITGKQVFNDRGNRPGQYYEYRVRALAKQSTSNFSNPAVVYGVL